jgi:hypothetical protein
MLPAIAKSLCWRIFGGQGARNLPSWKVCVGQKFYNALGRVAGAKK